MHTLGYRFKPWIHDKSIADGPSILEYLNETIDENNLRNNILLNHNVNSANWNSDKSIWELEIKEKDLLKNMTCNFLFLCGGYFSYSKPHMPSFKNQEKFLLIVVCIYNIFLHHSNHNHGHPMLQ